MGLRISDIIKKENIISKENFEKALEISNRDGIPFALFALQNDFIDEKTLMQTLEKALGVEFFDLNNIEIERSVLDLVPKEVAMGNRVIPINRFGNNLVLATGDPLNHNLKDKLSARLGIRIKFKLASELAIHKLLQKYYANKVEEVRQTQTSNSASQEASDGYAITYIGRLLQIAAQRHASDIHIEPFEKSMRVRIRIDGSLVEYENAPRLEMKDALTARVKIISNLNVAEKRLPQDGATKIDIPGVGTMDFRVSCLPVIHGEKIVMRLLDKGNLQLDMTKLGFEPEQLEIFMDSIHKPFGMVIVTGPTGSGKTTTLYSALNELNRLSDCVVTAEDPVEFQIPGIAQVHVRADIGLTFASALKSFLRQDPDVILVGEIRDFETAETAMKAALTGHIVLSTLHTNNAPETIERLKNMGVEPFTITGALNAIVAQRLIRKICPKCKQPIQTDPKILIANGLPEKYAEKVQLFRGTGCEFCAGTGYKGRAAIYEVMPMGEAIKEAVIEGKSALDLKKIAMANGMQTLRQSAWKKVVRGITTLEELLDSSSADNKK